MRTYSEPTHTAVTAAQAVGCSVGEIAKTLLFIVGGRPVVVVTAGDQKVQGSKLKRAIGLSGIIGRIKHAAADLCDERSHVHANVPQAADRLN